MARQPSGLDTVNFIPLRAPESKVNRSITLTFDNGPTAGVTPKVLDVLARHDVRATFFVLGQNLESKESRALVQRAAEEGHWIGNHTYTHDVPLGETKDSDAPKKEIGRTQELIGNLAHPGKLFRPFGGGGILGSHLLSLGAFEFLKAERYTCVLWNSIPHDWDDPDGWTEMALAQARQLSWTLTVLHDYETGAMRNLESYIERARAEGFSFRQAFPPDCVPMVRGALTLPMEAFISSPTTTLTPQET